MQLWRQKKIIIKSYRAIYYWDYIITNPLHLAGMEIQINYDATGKYVYNVDCALNIATIWFISRFIIKIK